MPYKIQPIKIQDSPCLFDITPNLPIMRRAQVASIVLATAQLYNALSWYVMKNPTCLLYPLAVPARIRARLFTEKQLTRRIFHGFPLESIEKLAYSVVLLKKTIIEQ